MSPKKRSHEVRTPMRMDLSVDQAMAIPGMAEKLPLIAGGQDEASSPAVCRDTFHQHVCVQGEITTKIWADCRTKVVCLGGGVGRGCQGTVLPAHDTCSFKFFENLCVEVDVVIAADADCRITDIVCGPAQDGFCPPGKG